MAVEHKADESSGEDGSWEKLAEDLLGIDFRKSSAAADVPEIDSLLTSETTPAKDPGASADDAASPESSPFGGDAQKVTDAADESFADEPEAATEVDSAARPDKEADTFWDPLNAWNWDKGTETAPKTEDPVAPKASSPARQTAVESAPTLSPRYEDSAVSESAADLRDEYIADSDFGFGLLDDDEENVSGGPETIESAAIESAAIESAAIEQPAVVESPSIESTPPDAEPAEVPETKLRRRRRGRGRRGRGRRPAEADSNSEQPEQGGSGLPEQTVAEPQTEAAPETGVEGALTDESSGKPRSGRRRSSRRRRRPSNGTKSAGQEAPATPESAAPEPVTVGSFTVESDDQSRDSKELAEAPALADDSESSSHKIPTWEEAISYLQHKQPPESRARYSGGPTGGRSSGDSRKS